MRCDLCEHAYAKDPRWPLGDVTCMKGNLVRYNAPRNQDDTEWGWQPLGKCEDYEEREPYDQSTS